MAQNFLSDIRLGDNIKIGLGDATNGDLRIYHDGTDSLITDSGAGNLVLLTNGTSIRLEKFNNEPMGVFTPDGSVELYYDSSKKFETTNTGVSITGSATLSSGSSLYFGSTSVGITGNASGPDYITFTTNSNERMRITSGGKVGIGISTPNGTGTNLQVQSDSHSQIAAHFGQGQSNSNTQYGGISLGYAEAANANYRKVAIVAEARGDGAARQNLHFLVDTANNDGSAVLADSKFNIDGLTGAATFAGDVTITGDLQVNGTTTTVNQTNLDVSDNIIGLNRGLTGVNANDSGIIIERGSSGDNAAFIWDESVGYFSFGTTQKTPSATGAVANESDWTWKPVKASGAHFKTSTDSGVSHGVIIERSNASDKGYINYQGGAFRMVATDGDPIKLGHVSNDNRFEITSSGNATFAGDVNVPSGYVGRDTHNGVYFSTDDSIIYRVADSHRFRMDSTTFRPYTDSSYDLGTDTVRWANVYADNLHGDGSNLTGVAADESRTIILTVKNKSGGSLSKGTLVHASPSATPPSGNVIEVVAAENDVEASMPALGVLNETLADEAEGECVVLGSISGISTTDDGTSSGTLFSVGDFLYVSDTAGLFTNVKPTGTKLIQKIGIVIKAHATNGTVEIFGAGRTNDVPTPLYIDHANQRVGIGATSPSTKLYVDNGESTFNRGNSAGTIATFRGLNSAQAAVGTATSYFLSDVGIGETSPDAKLHIKDDSVAQLYLERTGSITGTYRLGVAGANNNFYITDIAQGENRLIISDNGNVGIGLTPSYDLHLHSALTGVSDSSDFAMGVTSNDSETTPRVLFQAQKNGTNGGRLVINTLSGGSLSERARITSGGAVLVGTTSTTPAFGTGTGVSLNPSSNNHFSVNGSASIIANRTTSDGNIIDLRKDGSTVGVIGTQNWGIGTSSPDTTLHVFKASAGSVSGNANATLTLENSTSNYLNFLVPDANETGVLFGRASNNADGGVLYNSNITRGLEFRTGGNAFRMGIDSSGNVGIGTTSPTGKFNSYISATRQLTHNGNGGDLSIISDNNSSPVFYVKGTGTADLVNVFDNTSEVFTILDGGNVGIGTDSPVSKLETKDGDVRVTTLNSFSKFKAGRASIPSAGGFNLGGLHFEAYSTGTTYTTGSAIESYSDGSAWTSTSTPSYLSFQTVASGSTSLTERMRIASDGTVTLNAYTTAGLLQVNSSGVISTDTNTYLTTSSASSTYVPQSGGSTLSGGVYNINTNTNTNTLNISRGGGNTSEVMKIGIQDTIATFDYIEDTTNEGNGNFGQYRFILSGNDGETSVNALILGKSNATFAGDVTVTGDLIVNGTETILNTETVEVEDNIIVLNKTNTSMTATTSGISVYRGTSAAASFIFDDSDDYWDLTHNLAVAGDIKLADNNKIKGTTYSAGFISFESDGETRISANDDVVIGYGETLNISNTGVSTFAGQVEIPDLFVNCSANINSSSEKLSVSGMSMLSSNSDSVASLYVKNTSTTADTFQPYIYFADTGGNRAGFGVETSTAKLKINSQNAMLFTTGSSSLGGTTALTLDTSQNATFAGDVTVNGGDITVNTTGKATLTLNGDSDNSGDAAVLDSEIRMLHDAGDYGILLQTQNHAGRSSFKVVEKITTTETMRFQIDEAGDATFAGHVQATQFNIADIGDYITLYGDNSANHSISSRNSLGNAADDIRINSYGAIYLNLDSNNNNTSGADFMIGRHGGAGTISDTFLTINGETGNATFAGNVGLGDTTDISMSTSSAGQLRVFGNGYTGAIALNGSAMYLYHNSSSRALVLGTNETSRIVISGTGDVQINEYTKVYSTIGSADNVRTGLAHYDDTAQGAGVGGQLVLGYKYTDAGAYTEGAIIKMYKENGTSGNYGSGLKFQVRNHGNNLSTKVTFTPSGDVDATGNVDATNFRDRDDTSYSLTPDSTATGQWQVNTPSGNVRIGPANTTYSHFSTDRGRFYFNKNLVVDEGIISSYNEDLRLRRTESNNDSILIADTHISFILDGAEDVRLENDGDLHVEGDVIAYSTTVSDKALKDNVLTLENSLDKVSKLRGVEYTWNNTSRKGQKDIGVIAQEVEEVIPEIVREKKMSLVDGEKYKTVDYEKLTAVLIEAVKELKEEVEELKNKCNDCTK